MSLSSGTFHHFHSWLVLLWFDSKKLIKYGYVSGSSSMINKSFFFFEFVWSHFETSLIDKHRRLQALNWKQSCIKSMKHSLTTAKWLLLCIKISISSFHVFSSLFFPPLVLIERNDSNNQDMLKSLIGFTIRLVSFSFRGFFQTIIKSNLLYVSLNLQTNCHSDIFLPPPFHSPAA